MPFFLLASVISLAVHFYVLRKQSRKQRLISLVGAVLAGLLGAWLGVAFLLPDPSIQTPWRAADQPPELFIDIQWQEGTGVVAPTTTNAVRLAGPLPVCDPSGSVAAANLTSGGDGVAVTVVADPAAARIPASPDRGIALVQRLDLEMQYPAEMGASAAVSYALYDDGQVWCAERYSSSAATAAGSTSTVNTGLGGFMVGFLAVTFVMTTPPRSMRERSRSSRR